MAKSTIYSLMRQMGAIHYSSSFLMRSGEAKNLARRALLDGNDSVAVGAAELDYFIQEDLEFRLKTLLNK
jgi:hypothetical protein